MNMPQAGLCDKKLLFVENRNDELMFSCLGSLRHEELDISIKMCVIFKLHSQVFYTCTLQVSTRQSMATG